MPPIQNVIVYAYEPATEKSTAMGTAQYNAVGSSLTDASGRYSLRLSRNHLYLLMPHKTGFNFDPKTLNALPGGYASTITAFEYDLGNAGCASRDISASIGKFVQSASELHGGAMRGAALLTAVRSKVSGRVVTSLEQKVVTSLTSLYLMSQNIPTVVSACPTNFGCQTVSLRDAIGNHKTELRSLLQKTLAIAQKMSRGGGKLAQKAKPIVAKARQLYSQGLKALRQIPNAADLCN